MRSELDSDERTEMAHQEPFLESADEDEPFRRPDRSHVSGAFTELSRVSSLSTEGLPDENRGNFGSLADLKKCSEDSDDVFEFEDLKTLSPPRSLSPNKRCNVDSNNKHDASEVAIDTGGDSDSDSISSIEISTQRYAHLKSSNNSDNAHGFHSKMIPQQSAHYAGGSKDTSTFDQISTPEYAATENSLYPDRQRRSSAPSPDPSDDEDIIAMPDFDRISKVVNICVEERVSHLKASELERFCESVMSILALISKEIIKLEIEHPEPSRRIQALVQENQNLVAILTMKLEECFDVNSKGSCGSPTTKATDPTHVNFTKSNTQPYEPCSGMCNFCAEFVDDLCRADSCKYLCRRCMMSLDSGEPIHSSSSVPNSPVETALNRHGKSPLQRHQPSETKVYDYVCRGCAALCSGGNQNAKDGDQVIRWEALSPSMASTRSSDSTTSAPLREKSTHHDQPLRLESPLTRSVCSSSHDNLHLEQCSNDKTKQRVTSQNSLGTASLASLVWSADFHRDPYAFGDFCQLKRSRDQLSAVGTPSDGHDDNGDDAEDEHIHHQKRIRHKASSQGRLSISSCSAYTKAEDSDAWEADSERDGPDSWA